MTDRDDQPASGSGFNLGGSGFGGVYGSPTFTSPALERMSGALAAMAASSRIEVPDFEVDDSPQRTAESTEQMAQYVAELVQLTGSSLALTEQSREDNAKLERFTRRISWASLGISIASLAVAIASLIVAIVAITAQAS